MIRHFLMMAVAVALPTVAFAGSMKAAGMGQTSIAVPHDALAVYRNPSQSAEIDSRADVGFTWQQTIKSLEVSDREVLLGAITQSGRFQAANDNQYFPELGINYWITCDFAVGLAWNQVQHLSTHYPMALTDFSGVSVTGEPLGPNAGLDYDVDVLTGTAAYRINDRHSVGLGLNGYRSRFKLKGLGGALTQFSTDPSRLSDQGSDDAWGLGWTVGWTGQFGDCWTFGVSYSPQVHMDHFNRYEGLLAQRRIDIPAVARLGAAFTPRCDLTLAVDTEFRRYKRVRALSNAFIADSTTGFGPLFGERSGPGFGWRDQWVLSVGAEWAATSCLILRAGYRHESPVLHGQSTRTAFNVFTLNTVRDYLSVGATCFTMNCGELSLFGEAGISGTDCSHYPSNSGAETTNFLGGDLAFKSRLWRAGLAYGVRF